MWLFFTEVLVAWYRFQGVRLRGGVWLHDGGSEYLGSWQAREPSVFQQVLAQAGIQSLEIPKTTWNADVETIHNTIEFEFFEVDLFRDRRDFFRKVSGYQLWYNLARKNCNRNNKSPREILAEVAPQVAQTILLLPALNLDELLARRVSYEVSKSEAGGARCALAGPLTKIVFLTFCADSL